MTPEPTIRDLLEIAGSAIRGVDANADLLRGADYEALVGPSAIIWSREAQRDTDLFNAVNFNTAVGDDLTQLIYRRYDKDRSLDTYGSGAVRITRPSGGIAETIWTGTRLTLAGGTGRTYRVTEDVPVSSTDTQAVLPVEATVIGSGVAVRAYRPPMTFDDALQDSAWTVDSADIADGTDFEDAAAFRARVRTERLAARVGQASAIDAACRAAGAGNVVIFRSDYAGDAYDYGLNYCYVGTLGHTSTPELVKACALALRATRVAGDNMQVLQLGQASLDVKATVYLNDTPVNFDLARLERTHVTSIRSYLGNSGRYAYTLEGIRGAIARYSPEVQRVVLTTPTSDNNIVVGAMKNFPAVLTKYTAGTISLQYQKA